jgi:hypothetical protein
VNNFFQNFMWNGLGTFSFTIPANSVAGYFFLLGDLDLPQLSRGSSSPSQVVVTVTQNAGNIYTGNVGASGFRVDPYCSPGDVLAVTLTSAAPVDAGLNAIKATVQIGQGE